MGIVVVLIVAIIGLIIYNLTIHKKYRHFAILIKK